MKKTINFIVTFLVMGILGVSSIYAETSQLVNNESEFINALSDFNIDIIKLNDNFVYNSSFVQSTNNSSYKKTIDLNGYTISSNSKMEFSIYSAVSYDNFEFVMTDSSTLKNGKIVSTSSENVIGIWVYNLTNKLTVKLDNGIYESNNTGGRFFLFANGTEANRPGLDVSFKNTNISGKHRLVSTQKFNINEINISLDNFEYKAASLGTNVALVDYNTPFSSLFDSSKNDLYINDVLHTNLNDDASSAVENSIKIKSKTQLTLDPVSMLDKEYGYLTSDQYDLNIRNNHSTSISIDNIILSNTSAFEVIGTLPQTIAGNSSNNTLKIKAKLGLNSGTYSTNITVKVGSNEYYLGTVTFFVSKATINPTITMNNWTYGDTASTPTIIDNPSDGAKTYQYKDSTGETSTVRPEKPGTYELKVTIAEGTNHKTFTKTINFTIYKKELSISDVLISNKIYNYSNPALTVDQVSYNANVSNVTYVRHIVPKSGSGLFVGTGTALVYIAIKTENEYSEYYYFSGDNTVEIVVEASYNIVPTNINFIIAPGNDNETNTTLFVNRNSELNLLSIFDLNETTLKDRVTYSLLGPYPGVNISGKKLIIENSAPSQTIGVRLIFSSYDINGDGQVEFYDKTQDVFIKILDKEELIISGLNDNEVFDYDGNPKMPSGTITVEGDKVIASELEVIYNGIDGTSYNSTSAPVNAGKYTVTYKISDSNVTYSGTVTYNFVINKINPTYTLPTNLIGIKNNSLDTIVLPSGFVWKNPSEVMNAEGTKVFLVKYVPTDLDNYNQIEDINIEVYVKGIYNVVTNSSGNGTVTASISDVLEGTKVKIEFTPNLGYVIDKVFVNGVNVLITNNKLNIDVYENIEINVSYKKELFSINVIKFDSNQVSITPSGITYEEYGSNKDITIKVKDGYKLLFIKVNGVDKTSELVDNKLTLTNIITNYTIEVSVKKILAPVIPKEPEEETDENEIETNENIENYYVVEGSNQEILTYKDKPANFKINADYKLFLNVYVNGQLLDPSNYVVSSGSTVVTLKDSYLKTLPKGEYSLKVTFKDGGEAKTNFTIIKETDEEQIVDKNETPEEIKKSNYTIYYIIFGSVLALIIILVLINKSKEDE